jgi:predicted dehydrogenase
MDMMPQIENKIKVAFLGGAMNSAVGNAHYSALLMDNIYELVSGCFSLNDDNNHKTAEQYGVSPDRVYANLDELILGEKDLIDAIIILTPTDQHFAQVVQCIEHDIPVICEKALGTNSEEITQIKSALERHNGFLSVIYNYLGYPMIKEIRRLISKNVLGKVNFIQIEMPQEGFLRIDHDGAPIVPQDWRLKDYEVPTISLDLGVHLHMFIKYLTGEMPTATVSKSSSYGNFPSVIDNINCLIEYTNNVSCNMWFSKIAIGNRNGLKLRIYGEKGSAEWVQESPEIIHLSDSKGRRCLIDRGNEEVEISNQQRYSRFKVGHPAGFLEAFANYYQDIAITLQHYKAHRDVKFDECYGIDEAYEGLRLLEAIQKSSISRSWEKV